MSETRTVKKPRKIAKRPRHKSDLGTPGIPVQKNQYYCGWCYTPKQGTNQKCPNCSSFMTTGLPQSQISHVYIEDIPA